MPRLPTYTADVPESANINTAQAAGSRLTTAGAVSDLAGAGIAETLLSNIEAREQRQVMVRNVETRAKYEQRLQQAVISGEDVDKIKEEFDNEQSKVYDDLQTRKGRETADYYTAETGRLFDAKTNAVKVERAVAEGKLDGTKFIIGLSDILRSNAAYLPQAERDIDNFIGTLHKVPYEQRIQWASEMKNNAHVITAMAQAKRDPNGTITAVNSGAFSLTPQQVEQVIHEAERTKTSQRVDAEYQYTLREREKKEIDSTGFGEHLKTIFGGTYNGNAAIQDARLKPQTLEHLQVFAKSWAREQAEGAKRSDPTVLKDLWYGAHAPEGDPRRFTDIFPVIKAVRDQQINTTDGNMLLTAIEQQKDENGRTVAAKTGSTVKLLDEALGRNPRYQTQTGAIELAGLLMQYQSDIYREISRVRGEGGNVHDLFNPASKFYVGSQEFVEGSMRAFSDQRKTIRDAAMGDVMKLKSGKTLYYKGVGDKENMANWSETPPAKK